MNVIYYLFAKGNPVNIFDEFMTKLKSFLLEWNSSAVFEGTSPEDIASLQQEHNEKLPSCYLSFLKAMGNSNPLETSSPERGITYYGQKVAKQVAAELEWEYPDNIFPFAQHDGYIVLYLELDANDPPIGYRMEQHEPVQIDATFSAWLRRYAVDMIENHFSQEEFLREISQHRDNWLARKSILDEYQNQIKIVRQKLVDEVATADKQAGKITDMWEFQAVWVKNFPRTEIYQKLKAEKKRIPYYWLSPKDAN